MEEIPIEVIPNDDKTERPEKESFSDEDEDYDVQSTRDKIYVRSRQTGKHISIKKPHRIQKFRYNV